MIFLKENEVSFSEALREWSKGTTIGIVMPQYSCIFKDLDLISTEGMVFNVGMIRIGIFYVDK